MSVLLSQKDQTVKSELVLKSKCVGLGIMYKCSLSKPVITSCVNNLIAGIFHFGHESIISKMIK